MVVYIFLVAWCLLWGYLEDRLSKRNKYNRLIVRVAIFLPIFLVSALRYNVGTDYAGTYTECYNLLINNQTVRMDLFPLWLYKIIIACGANLQWFFVITSFFITFFVCKSISELSENNQLSYFIYICGTFYFFSMNGIRQAMAMSVFYYALKYIVKSDEKKSVKDYLKTTIMCPLLHLSEIMFVPLFLFLRKKIPSTFKLASLVVLYFCNGYLMPYIFSFMAKTKYYIYVSHWKYTAMESLNASMILNLLILLLYEVIINKNKETNKNIATRNIVYDNIHYIGALVSMFATSLPLCLRIFMNFRFVEYLSIPNILTNISNKYRKLVAIGVFVLYFAYFVLMVGVLNGNEVLPYHTIFYKTFGR